MVAKLFTVSLVCLVLSWAGQALAASGIPEHTVGDFKVYLLSESQRDGNSSILIGASEAMIREHIPGGTYPSAVNAFLIRTPDRTILVDTGYGTELFQNLEKLGVAPNDVDVVLLTHMHGDHIGGLLRNGTQAFPRAVVMVAEQERAYWYNLDGVREADLEKFLTAQQAVGSYRDRLRTFRPEALENAQELLPGIKAAAAFGHTPGHTVFLVESGSDQLLIWGDLAHAMAIQMPLPEVAVTYDVDPRAAVSSRQKVLRFVAEKNIPVAGMHIAWPGMGTVQADATGQGYVFTPLEN